VSDAQETKCPTEELTVERLVEELSKCKVVLELQHETMKLLEEDMQQVLRLHHAGLYSQRDAVLDMFWKSKNEQLNVQRTTHKPHVYQPGVPF
jgi:replicative superfamily II helicase